jgi:peptidoglycan/LPS O-acetylase OafA/YrhL
MTKFFRSEIAGLRALAVTSVLLFHLKIPGFPGGFTGVDVFFVISGYLITRNILGDLQAKEFSFAQFYIRRTRRIYPALIFTVVATYVIGALWCSPLMFLDIAKECTHALLSIANIQYWRESHNYFAPNSEELALLHCWSLSLEEQFYLVWPPFIALAYRVGRVREAMVIATVTSFGAAIAVAKFDASAAFFLTPFRIFEFGCGALVLFVENVRLRAAMRELLSAAGIVAIISGALFLKSDMPHLEVAMLLPCLGAAATILAGGKTRVSSLITFPIFKVTGNISYSLYLCHWPIIFYARFIFGEAADSLTGILFQLIATFAVAGFMYRFVERQFILPSAVRSISFMKNAVAFWSIVVALAAVTHVTFVSKGFAWRLSDGQEKLSHMQDFPSQRDIEAVDGPVTLLVVGDSHATQYYAGLSPLMRRLGIRMEAFGGAGCPILYGMSLKRLRRDECILARDTSLRQIGQIHLPMIFVQKWTYYDDATVDYKFADPNVSEKAGSYTKLERALESTLEQFVADGRNVLLIGAQVSTNCFINLPRLLQGPLPHAPLKPCPPSTRESIEKDGAATNEILARIAAKWPDKIQLLKPVDYFCDSECPVFSGGYWLYHDRTHFTVAGSNYMVSHAEAPFTKFLRSTLVRYWENHLSD